MRSVATRILSAAAGLIVTAAVAFPASATLMIEADVEQLARWSDDVVVGTVENVFVEWADKKHSKIYTHAFIHVDETIAGKAKEGEVVHVIQLGGKKDNLVMPMPGAPNFEKGEQIVLFLEERRNHAGERIADHFMVPGMFQGKFDLFQRDGKKYVRRDRIKPGVGFATPDGKISEPVADPNAVIELSLDELSTRVQKTMEVKR